MAFIDTIDDHEIDAEVRAMYERQQGHYGYVPNYAKAFCHRPHVMKLWADLQNGIRREMDKRRFELVTFAAAHALRSTACSIAHGTVLARFIPAADVLAISRGETPASLSPAEAAMVAFAVDPAGNAGLLADVACAQLAAIMRPVGVHAGGTPALFPKESGVLAC